jgi:hypothetical protein
MHHLQANQIQAKQQIRWQARRESNPQPAVLETAALPIELLAFEPTGETNNVPQQTNFFGTKHPESDFASSVLSELFKQVEQIYDPFCLMVIKQLL